ncbi:hypothetical protein GH714_027515 [Hevea brasiliensis]|uniref:Uncharacterized protein n=1 Tax=Hevea brasiliensis TaxID=3981 RepID=A0A6A6LBF5_HEVBR|nr:hypothetical protein GH714_027515 [Hevea brasiliensis]
MAYGGKTTPFACLRGFAGLECPLSLAAASSHSYKVTYSFSPREQSSNKGQEGQLQQQAMPQIPNPYSSEGGCWITWT